MVEDVKEDDYVVLMKSFDSGNMKVVQAQQGVIVHYGKLHFDSSPLIGSKYGDVFEIKQGTMCRVENFELFDINLSEQVSNKMSTLNDKTQFSREKIIRKKKKKSHSNIVTLIQPTLSLVNEMLFARDKIGGLRADILAQLLTLSNAQNGSKCLLLDHNLGMITSAIMSRILPDGVCIQLVQDYEVIQTTRRTLNMLNIKETDFPDNLCSITIRDLFKIFKKIDTFQYESDVLRARHRDHLKRLANLESVSQDMPDESKRMKFDENSGITQEETSATNHLPQTLIKKETNRATRQRERMQAARILKDEALDSIIIVVQNDHPLPILKMSYQFLAPSRQFVIYSDTMDPLLECYQYLKENCLAVGLTINESWLRKYQVLPDRTRPEMNVSGYGGYLLSGTKAIYKSETTDTCDGSAPTDDGS